MIRRLFLASLIVGSGCSITSKLTGHADSTPKLPHSDSDATPSGGPTSVAPKVAADEDDPDDVRAAIRDLSEAEGELAKADFQRYSSTSARYNYSFYVKKEYDQYKKAPQLKARLEALDAKAVAMVGGDLAKNWGDGMPVTAAKSPEAIEAVQKAIDLCDRATDTAGSYHAGETHATRIRDNVKKYEDALARALRADPGIVRYVGDTGSGTIYVPGELMKCESRIADARIDIDDEYQPEEAKGETEKGCGREDFLADGIQTGSNVFASYHRTAGGESYPEKIACSKIPAKTTAPRAFADAIHELEDNDGVKVVVAVDGKPWVEESQDDYRLHRFQKLVAYSKSFSFAKNPCGPGDKMFCEAGGSKTARMFNELQHHIARAEVHAGTRPDRCKAHLKDATKLWEEFQSFHDDAVKSHGWIAGATYKTHAGEKLSEKDLLAKFEQQAKLADDRVLGDYCTHKQTK